ncbi:MAG: COX aromatic rich motif-containing protein [Alicyclobacillus herbarius]|uniref:ubiquinol oxidase subunit II n=1 Tax=Alicyclobacillus herbarius TaxID=122960 RepID=UPI00054FD494|nr:COX aromatic rich motif-containing protein [Alicyclobacillus herbarius]MCL6633281.1 COX aromatic rich motif-containing protein [Alicyclobacillus herbarius]
MKCPPAPTRWLRILPVAATCLLLSGCTREQFLVFNPVGPVATIEMHLIILSLILVGIVVVPVILLLWYIVHRFRDRPDNKAPYRPEWSESKTLEAIWWGIPIVIIGILAVNTVHDTFRLTRPPEPTGSPLTIHVTSLDWKWLFQYPDQKIATVNYCYIPTGRPIQFVLTADAPMNSFWVPQLGGQEYTMPGMAMRLWLQANKPGTYFGSGANFTGRGFAHMKFDVIATSNAAFEQWATKVRQTAPALTRDGYAQLVKQSVVGRMSFSSFPPGLFKDIIMREGGMYMKHDVNVLDNKA